MQPPAGMLAARAHGVVRRCGTSMTDQLPQAVIEDYSGQLILTIDYSRARLTAPLLLEECGIFEYRRIVHDIESGADKLNANFHDLESTLRTITTLPLTVGNGVGIQRISELVLLGDFAGDTRLSDALKKVLGQKLIRRTVFANVARAKTTKPPFAASKGNCAGITGIGCISRLMMSPTELCDVQRVLDTSWTEVTG